MAGARRSDERRPRVASGRHDVRRAAPPSGVRRRAHPGGRRAHRPPTGIAGARRVDRPLVVRRGPGRRPGCRRSRARRRVRVRDRRSRRTCGVRRGTTWAARWRHAEKRALDAIEASLAGTNRSPSPALRTWSPRRSPKESGSSWPPRCRCATSSGSEGRARSHTRTVAPTASTVSCRPRSAGRWPGTPTVALVGDIAFVHDSNALVGLAQPGGRPPHRRRRQRRGWHLLVPPPGDSAPRRSVRDAARHAARHRHRGPRRRPWDPRVDDHRRRRAGRASDRSPARGSSASRRTAPRTSSSTTA